MKNATKNISVTILLIVTFAAITLTWGSTSAGPIIEKLKGAKKSLNPISLNVFSLLQSPVSKKPSYKPNEVLVKFKPYMERAASKTILSNLNMHAVKHHALVDVHLTRTPPGMSVEEAVKKLNKDPSVQYAEPNYIYYAMETIPNDPDFDLLWGLHNTGQTNGASDADIDAPEAWDLQTGSSEVVIAVIDTGVDYTHIDLVNNMWTNEGEIPGDGIDNDGNGYVDDVHGINAIDGSGDPMDDLPDFYHGTHCAGTIAAEGNNGIGVAGVCWSAKIMALKPLNEEGIVFADGAIECIEYMIDMKNNYGINVKASSNSWGGRGYSHSLYDAINLAKDSDILFIAAAGNAGTNNDITPFYPASYDCLNIISVAASDDGDQLASFSCYGYNSVDVAAPGVDIWSAKRGDDYQYLSGTSMATPHVAGLAGLIYTHYPNITYSGVKEKLFRTVDEKNYLKDSIASGGRINAYSALTVDVQGPFIYPLSPWAASYGNEIIIEGAQLGAIQGSGYVTFFDTIKASIISWNDHQIVCTVPEECQSGSVTITTDEGLESNEKIFNLTGSISGRVTEETSGEGIKGVQVYVYGSNGMRLNFGSTDSNGDYSVTGLSTGDYYVRISNEQGYSNYWYRDDVPEECDYPPVHVDTPHDTPNIDFALAIGGSISGRVTVDPGGEPILKIAVFVSGDNLPSSIADYTDSNGEYSITGLPTGDYRVRTNNNLNPVYIDEYYKDTLDYRNITLVHVEAPNSIADIDFALAVGGSISGRVTVDPGGEPIKNVSVEASGSNGGGSHSGFTDSNGDYSITGLSTGDYYVFTDNDQEYSNEYYDNVWNSENAILVHAEKPTNTPGIDFSLTVGGSISGRVTDDPGGEPVIKMRVRVYGDNLPSLINDFTDSNGDYSITGLPTGDYYVRTENFNEGYFDEWYQNAGESEGDDPPVHIEAPNDTPNTNFMLDPLLEDDYENDDIADQAQFIDTIGTPQNHTLYPAHDVDWLRFEVSNETSYIIETYDLSPESDTHLFLYDTDGSTILEEDDSSGEGQASKIIYTFHSDGTYYVKVKHDRCLKAGSYSIRVSRECISDTDCDDGLFCNGIETCANGVCQPGENPCLSEETCDEESDRCLPPLIIELIPDQALRSHLIPLPLSMLIIGTDTDFDSTTTVDFKSAVLTSPWIVVLSPNLIFLFSLVNPADTEVPGSAEVEVTVTTEEGIGTETLTLNMLPWILEH